jgi:hypothetical protein
MAATRTAAADLCLQHDFALFGPTVALTDFPPACYHRRILDNKRWTSMRILFSGAYFYFYYPTPPRAYPRRLETVCR